MKFCPYCGEMINDDAQKTCTTCGKELEVSSVNSVTQDTASAGVIPPQQAYPMKWFKFLIYFSLFASAFFNAVTAIQLFSGNIYGDLAEDVYRVYGGIKTFDAFYAVVLLGIAAIAIVARIKLAGYKADGPKFLYILYIADLVAMIVYNVGVTAITGENIITVQTVTSIVVSGVMIFANYIYFNKRKALFCN